MGQLRQIKKQTTEHTAEQTTEHTAEQTTEMTAAFWGQL